jgi:hypothetical protein
MFRPTFSKLVKQGKKEGKRPFLRILPKNFIMFWISVPCLHKRLRHDTSEFGESLENIPVAGLEEHDRSG